MRFSSPRQLAILVALISSGIAAFSFLLTFSLDRSQFWLGLIFSVLLIFGFIYYFLFNALNTFIVEKINPIYKTIHNITIPKGDLRSRFEEQDIISEVNKDVINWAKKKTKEIAQLKEMEKYRKEFLGNVSHELKTPIFNIQGYVLTLLDGGLEDTSINRQYLERTEKSINRMISIVEDLESIARLESGELKLEWEQFNIVQLFEDVFEMHEMRAKKNKVKLKFDKSYDKPMMVNADRKRIFEVVNNLIVNSINYGKKNGATYVGFMDMGENWLIEVTDNGIGIGEKDLARIFERFYRTDKSRSRDQGGTGLGLAIVKHIIEAHNQTINVRSTIDVGTSFAFTLAKA